MQNDELVEDVIVNTMTSDDTPREKVQMIYDECKEVKGSTACETAFRVYECYLKNKDRSI